MTKGNRRFSAFCTLFLLVTGGLNSGCSSDELTADDLLERSSDAYRNHTGYSHRLEWRYAVEIPAQNINSHGSGNHALIVDEDRNFRFGEFFGGIIAYRQGDEFIAHRPYSSKFISDNMETGQSWSDSVPVVGELIPLLDPAALLATGQLPDWRDHGLFDFQSATLIRDEANSRLGIQIKADTSLFFGGPGDSAVLWFDPDTYLLRSMSVDSFKNFIKRQNLPEASEGLANFTLDVVGVATGPQASTGLRAFAPRPRDQEVERLVPLPDEYESTSIMTTVGHVAPPIIADTLGGEKFSLDSLRGNVILLDFWASWCGHCMRSRPGIKGIGERFEQDALQIVSISLDDQGDRDTVEEIVDSSGIRAIEIHDYANAISTDYRVDATPTFVLLNQSGIIEHVMMGPLLDTNLADLESRISSLMQN